PHPSSLMATGTVVATAQPHGQLTLFDHRHPDHPLAGRVRHAHGRPADSPSAGDRRDRADHSAHYRPPRDLNAATSRATRAASTGASTRPSRLIEVPAMAPSASANAPAFASERPLPTSSGPSTAARTRAKRAASGAAPVS